MSRTFTLARLMLGITAFCLVCGLAVNFPDFVIGSVGILSVFAPPAIAWLVLARFAKWRGSLAWNLGVGAFIGFITASIFSSGQPWGPWWLDYLLLVAPATIGAFAFGVVGLLDESIAARGGPR
jgi:hypothetical protein